MKSASGTWIAPSSGFWEPVQKGIATGICAKPLAQAVAKVNCFRRLWTAQIMDHSAHVFCPAQELTEAAYSICPNTDSTTCFFNRWGVSKPPSSVFFRIRWVNGPPTFSFALSGAWRVRARNSRRYRVLPAPLRDWIRCSSRRLLRPTPACGRDCSRWPRPRTPTGLDRAQQRSGCLGV